MAEPSLPPVPRQKAPERLIEDEIRAIYSKQLKEYAQSTVPPRQKNKGENTFTVGEPAGGVRLAGPWVNLPSPYGCQFAADARSACNRPVRMLVWPLPSLMYPPAEGLCGCPNCGDALAISTVSWSEPLAFLDENGYGLSIAQKVRCNNCSKTFQSTDAKVRVFFFAHHLTSVQVATCLLRAMPCFTLDARFVRPTFAGILFPSFMTNFRALFNVITLQFLANCPVFVQNEMPLIYTGQTAILKTSMMQWLHDLISGKYIW